MLLLFCDMSTSSCCGGTDDGAVEDMWHVWFPLYVTSNMLGL